jgi:hypothetical protein
MGEQVVASPFREYREELGGTFVAFLALQRVLSFFNFFARRFSEWSRRLSEDIYYIGLLDFFRMESSVGLGSDDKRFLTGLENSFFFLFEATLCISRHCRMVWGIVLSYYRTIVYLASVFVVIPLAYMGVLVDWFESLILDFLGCLACLCDVIGPFVI